MEQSDKRFIALQALGAGEFEHLNGSLVSHLTGTFELLTKWRSHAALCDAGLFHAAYGTVGFDACMVSLDQREKVANIIGREAEALVYLYCSCDRDYVFTDQVFNDSAVISHEAITGNRIHKGIAFRDRFTGKEFMLNKQQTQDFCELTLANELELLLTSEDFVAQYGEELLSLFTLIHPYLSPNAVKAYQAFFAKSYV